MDVESLYPSLHVEPTSQAIKDMILESDIDVIGVNWKELGIFLRKNMSTVDIETSMFEQFIPSKRKKVRKVKGQCEYDLWIFS